MLLLGKDGMGRKKDRCSVCGGPIGRYPDSGGPLVHGGVCPGCNVSAVLPWRYFMATHAANANALIVRGGKITLVRASDGTFAKPDLELYLGKDPAIEGAGVGGLLLAHARNVRPVGVTLAEKVLWALKGPERPVLAIVPERLLKGGGRWRT